MVIGGSYAGTMASREDLARRSKDQQPQASVVTRRRLYPAAVYAYSMERSTRNFSPFQSLKLAFFLSSHKMPFVEQAVTSSSNWLRLKDKDFLSGISWQIHSWSRL